MNSDTPRTDPFVSYLHNEGNDEVVPAEVARTLERELFAMTKERNALRADAENYRKLMTYYPGEVLQKVMAVLEEHDKRWTCEN